MNGGPSNALRHPVTWTRQQFGDAPLYPIAMLAGLNLLDELDARALWVAPAPLEITLSDRADELVLGTAVAGGAAYLVSNDAVLLTTGGYHGIHIVRPALFLDALRRALTP